MRPGAGCSPGHGAAQRTAAQSGGADWGCSDGKAMAQIYGSLMMI